MRALELQEAIYSRLTGYAPLMTIATAVYDHVPQDNDPQTAVMPYVVIGDNIGTPADTDDTLNSDDVISIHCWSRYRGKKEAKRMQQQIYNALHRYVSMTVENASYIDANLVFQEIFTDDDGLTRHGVQRFLYLVDNVG